MSPETIEERLAAIEVRLGYIQETTVKIEQSLQHYVTHAEFRPIRNGFYGLVTAIGLAFVAALNRILFK